MPFTLINCDTARGCREAAYYSIQPTPSVSLISSCEGARVQSMQLIFTKGSGKYDTMDVVRPGHDIESIQCPKQRIIPHDMVHYAVENTLQKRGFLGRVRDGEAASFQMQADAESDSVERLVEVIQGDAWSGSTSKPEDMLDLYQVTCRARECPSLPIAESDIESIRECVADITQQWGNVAVGSTLVIEFPESNIKPSYHPV
jgi:hypothetical protein